MSHLYKASPIVPSVRTTVACFITIMISGFAEPANAVISPSAPPYFSKVIRLAGEKEDRQAERERQRAAERFLTDTTRDINRTAEQLRNIFSREIERSVGDLHTGISREGGRSIARLQAEVQRVVERNVARLRAEISEEATHLQGAGARRLLRESERLANSIVVDSQRALDRAILRMETDLQRETLRSDTDLQNGLSRQSERAVERLITQLTTKTQAAAELIRTGASSSTQELAKITTELSNESSSARTRFGAEANSQTETETQETIADVMQAAPTAEQVGTDANEAARAQIRELRQASRKLDRKVTRRAMRAQALAGANSNALTTQFDQVVSRDVNSTNAQFAAIMNNAHYIALSSQLSLFTVSGVSKLEHGGFKVQSNGVTSDGFGFEAVSYGLTIGMRWDASRYFDMKDERFIVGVLGNYTRTNIGIEADSELQAAGIEQTGEGEVDTVSGGLYSVLNFTPFYLISYASYSSGSPNYDNMATDSTGSFNTQGILSSAMIGSILTLSDTLKIDVRGGFVYALQDADDYTDSDGVKYSNSNVSDSSARISAKLFSLHQYADFKLRPFLQVGVSDRLDYTNKINVDGDRYSFQDAGQHIFGRVGVDVEVGDGVQSYISVGGDQSADSESVSGQLGVTIKTN